MTALNIIAVVFADDGIVGAEVRVSRLSLIQQLQLLPDRTCVVHVFLRTPRAGRNSPSDLPDSLTFEITDTGEVRDVESGSTWDTEAGVAVAGPLKGTLLQRAPHVSALDWAWGDFNPHSVYWSDVLDTSE